MTLKHGGTPHQRRCTQTYRKTRSTGGKEAAKTPTLSPKHKCTQITETTTCLSSLCLKLGLSRVEKRRYLDNSDWKWTKQVAESQLIKPACSLIRNELFDQHKHCAHNMWIQNSQLNIIQLTGYLSCEAFSVFSNCLYSIDPQALHWTPAFLQPLLHAVLSVICRRCSNCEGLHSKRFPPFAIYFSHKVSFRNSPQLGFALSEELRGRNSTEQIWVTAQFDGKGQKRARRKSVII